MERESTSALHPDGLYWPRVSLQNESWSAHTKAVMCRTADAKYVRRLYEDDELYDLRADPREEHNLAMDPAHAGLKSTMAERLLTWYQETADVVPIIPDSRS